MTSDVMTRQEAISYLALDRQGLRDPMEALRWLCRTGRLRCVKVGRRICFRKAWLDDFLNQPSRERRGGRADQACRP